MVNHPNRNRTNRQISLAIVQGALGYAGDRKNYKLRIANGYEFCKRWLEANHDFHGIELDDGVLAALHFLCDAR